MATITKLNSGAYRIRVSCGYTAAGKQIVRSMNWKPAHGMSEKQIEKELNRQAVQFEDICSGRGISGNIKFETFARQWFEEYAKVKLRIRTIARLHQLEERTYAAIGHLRMDKINVRHVQAFINNLQEDGINKRTGGGLSPKTVRHYLSFISGVFDYAQNCGFATGNPCKAVILPELKKKPPEYYTLDEAQKFIDTLNTDTPIMYRVFFLLAIYGGFRRGELLGLEWRDIDFKNCTVSICRTSLYTPSTGIFTDTTKTEQSRRVLKLPSDLFPLLGELRKEQVKRGVSGSGRLFVNEIGEPLGTNAAYYWLKRFCAAHGLRFLGIHAFRHLNASLLISTGADVKTVSAALGHSQATTTLNIYTHAFAEAQAAASDAVADKLKNKIS